MTDGRWTLDRAQIGEDPVPIPLQPFEGARILSQRISKQDIDKFGATARCQGCNAIKDNTRAQVQSGRCRERVESCFRITPQGAERLDRNDQRGDG